MNVDEEKKRRAEIEEKIKEIESRTKKGYNVTEHFLTTAELAQKLEVSLDLTDVTKSQGLTQQ